MFVRWNSFVSRAVTLKTRSYDNWQMAYCKIYRTFVLNYIKKWVKSCKFLMLIYSISFTVWLMNWLWNLHFFIIAFTLITEFYRILTLSKKCTHEFEYSFSSDKNLQISFQKKDWKERLHQMLVCILKLSIIFAQCSNFYMNVTVLHQDWII